APIPTSAEREFDVAKALLSAQNALPRIQAHMNARRYEDAALLLDQTRGRVSEARARSSDKRLKKSLEDVAKKAERMADRLEDCRSEALADLPPGAVLVGPPSPKSAEPIALAAAGDARKDDMPAGGIAATGDLPLPGDENDPSYSLPAVDEGSIPVESHPMVDKWVDYFTGRGRPTFERWLERSGRYMDSMKAILEKEGVPTDLVHVVFVESGFNPQAKSVASAVGPWQFIRGTANLFGLKVNSWVDQRKDPEASTVAAARYLKHLHGLFNSWPLALASYNAGEGAVGRAIKRQGTRDFWSLRLPEETRNYVPKFMAVLAISRDPSRYGFDRVAIAEPLVFDEVTIPGPVDLRALAEACGTDVTKIRELNPQFLRGAAPAQGNEVTIRVPDGAGEELMESLADGSLTLPKVATPADPAVLRHKVKRGESLKALALRYGVPASTIARVNKLGKSSRLRVGRTLRIPMSGSGEVGSSRVAGGKSSGKGKVAAAKSRTVHVRRGQTLSQIASTHGVSVAQLRRANGLSSRAALQAGQRLKIPRAS
ncbi:MAG: LysM peptidoglycan-binding domain-containing protein, partial [Candidatus Eisenbacteria bacterium]